MSFVKIYIHAVWATKHRKECLIPDKLEEMCRHIISNAQDQGIFIDTINGHLNHLHVLMTAKNDLSISKQIQLLKGESAHWANANNIFNEHFNWARKYFAASVSGLKVPIVRNYILRQEEHHRTNAFVDEYRKFVTDLGYPWPKDDQTIFE